ncbi:hypothetical protein SCP_0804090 [Sparassis crispa]|uniref:B box-type domain-containing protein n=1 Tax=Sparassis crispa TaxID=139825 RepID=A0A401GUH4_9APHY|nr:hypothetical protein SCP_0804090 [Sparassis crispa]GBE85885.1 hypothetical protein SCP_0804090 [Sparassis crispa]
MHVPIHKPLPKRRRLLAPANSQPLSVNPTVRPLTVLSSMVQSRAVDAGIPSRPPVCSSCHRTCPKAGMVVQCARCRAPTCTICTRTCTARPVADDSSPPTPALTLSPSPPSTPLPTPSPSPRRRALVLSAIPNTTRRRKREADADEGDTATAKWGCARDAECEPGCARTVCRACCVESAQSGNVTCLDCWYAAGARPERCGAGVSFAAEWSGGGAYQPPPAFVL